MSLTDLKKKLLYQSAHRGCKELDIILSGFIKSRLDLLKEKEVGCYAKLLAESDNDIYDWIAERKNPPKEYKSIVTNIIMFNRNEQKKS